MPHYMLVSLVPDPSLNLTPDAVTKEVGAAVAQYGHAEVRTADVTCFEGCQGLDFRSLTDLLQ